MTSARLLPHPLPGLLRLALLLALVSPGLPPEARGGPRSGQWAHEVAGASLQPDSRVVWGRLDNGLRYALRPHQGVPGRVSMRLVVLTGSMDERPDELGIAHFTEHMCFRGTREFRYEDMIGFFHKLGMEYGSDVNAVTTFDYTAYLLDFRENDAALLGEGLRLFRNFADGVVFDPAIIEKERGVILAEMRTRDGLAEQQSWASLPLVFKGLEFPNRPPIGTEERIRAFTREHFVRFYERGYRPDLMVLVAAGDFSPPDLVGMITQHLGAIPRPATPPPERAEGRLDTAKALRAGLFKVTDIGSAAATVASVAPASRTSDSREARLERLRRSYAINLLANRINSSIPDSGGGSATLETMQGHDAVVAHTTVAGASWAHGILSLDQVVRSTYERGFEQREVEQLQRRLRSLLQHLAEQAPELDPSTLAEGLSDSITGHEVYLGYEEDFRLLQQALAGMTPQNLLQAYRAAWDLDRMAFHVAGDVTIEGGSGEILTAVQKYRRGGLRYLQARTRREAKFELRNWGPTGKVASRTEVPELGATLLRFENNVRLNLIPNRSSPGIVHGVVRVGTGLLEMPGEQPALKEFGLQTLLASGTTHFTTERLGELIEDRLLGFALDVDDFDAFTFRGISGAENLDAFLGIVTDFLYKPIFETFALRSEKLKAAMGRVQGGMGLGEGMRELTNHLFKGDARFTWGTFNDYLGMSVSEVRNWLQGPFLRGYVEVTLAGDITEEEAVRLVSRTLAALPARAGAKTTMLPPRPPRVTAAPGFKRIEFVGENHLGLVTGTWPVVAPLTVKDKAALNVLGKLLELRIREEVRDRRGLAYSPSVTFTPYNGFPEFALLQSIIDCAPSEAGEIARIVEDIAQAVSEKGVGESEFIGSRGILKGQVRRAFRENDFLLNLFERAQERPESVGEALALRDALIDSVTIEEVDRWARRLLSRKNTYTAAIVPKPFIGIFQTGGP